MSAAMNIEITALTSASGLLTKRISLTPDGKLNSDGSACVMNRGHAERVRLQGVGDFAMLIGGLRSDQAIALGSLRAELPERVEIATARRIENGTATNGAVARTAGNIGYQSNVPAFALLDFDTKGMPEQVVAKLTALGGFWSALVTVAPELAHAPRVVRRSTSSGILRSDTGAGVPGSDGQHVFVLVRDGADVERFLRTLHDRCWLAGLGWMMVGAGGQMLERSLVDRMVFAAERLVFEGPPSLQPPLIQDVGLRTPVAHDGEPVDTALACRPLTIVERATLRDLRAADMYRLSGPAGRARDKFVHDQAERLAVRTGVKLEVASAVVRQQCKGTLLPAVGLPFDADELSGATVGDVLADPERFIGATLADPLEGIGYGRGKAKLMRREDGSMWVNSFAHGRTTYELKHDAAAVETAIRKAEPGAAADVFVRMLLNAVVEPDEEQRLRDMAMRAAGVAARPLNAKLKAARGEQAAERDREARQRAEAKRTDRRLRLPVPPSDSERLPVLRAIDDVLCAVPEPEPPMRDLDGDPVEVRTRAPMLMHELTAGGSNRSDPEAARLPAPALPLLTKHDKFSFAHLLEQHIEYETEGSDTTPPRAVALPQVFVDHFMAYRDSALPRVGGIVTAPLVLPDGSLLATNGLDRSRKLVFRIDRELLAQLPATRAATPENEKVVQAMHFLANEWLVDVATDFKGKCVVIALVATILERVLLPERPAFFVTAGKRGGGKTTALAMAILAATGKKPAASAWSNSEDERRKAMLAYLAEGLAAMVFDNIPLGTTISCPTIEKILTAETYSDRILGETANMTVPAFTIITLTGNNIGARGDMASRSLEVRLDVDRPDPENRPFRHSDPIAWTLGNRAAILQALYVVLLANPQLREPREPRTRFKWWWHLVGSAIEHAASALTRAQLESLIDTPDGVSEAELIDFASMFRAMEGEDEETNSLADILDVLVGVWPTRSFEAKEVCTLITSPMKGEEEQAKTLRDFFDPQGKAGGAGEISPRIISRRLGNVADAPVWVGGRILKLVQLGSKGDAGATRTKRLTYQVKSV